MRALDTNVLVRLIVRDDADQLARAEAFVESGAWVSLLVLGEAVWVLQSTYGLDRQRVATVVNMLLDHDRLVLQDEDVVRRAHTTFRGEGTAGFSDCLIVETASKAGHRPVGTFDRRLSRVDGAERL